MAECFRKKFICNGEIKSAHEFNCEYLNSSNVLYEVIRIIDGVPLFLEDHITRLNNSAKTINLKLNVKKEDIKEEIYKLCKANDVFLGNIKIIIDVKDNKDQKRLTYFIKHSYPKENMYEKGVFAALYNAERDNPNAKIINAKLREDTNRFIKENDIYEAILVDKNGCITEGSRSTIFMVKGNNVYTSPIEDVLPGVTRKHILGICKTLKINVIEEKIHFTRINTMDALFICGTSPKVLPICKIKNNEYNANNEIVQKIKKSYDKTIQEYITTYKN